MKHSPGFLAVVEDAKSRVEEMTVAEYAELAAAGEPHLLVDVREESEWGTGHATGAVHLGKGIIERDIEGRVPDHETLLVLYCGGGFRSALAGDTIQRMGYRNVRSLAGGWKAWQAAAMPVSKPGAE
ncbi:MAG: sulfurtransferase [Bryobacterales bacterium]|nr:sulfurtransferase [Bryobacterales bacterium]